MSTLLIDKLAEILSRVNLLQVVEEKAAEAHARVEGALPVEVAPNFQPYIFWAYGMACGLLGLFTIFTIWQTRQIGERVGYLERRLEDAEARENK